MACSTPFIIQWGWGWFRGQEMGEGTTVQVGRVCVRVKDKWGGRDRMQVFMVKGKWL